MGAYAEALTMMFNAGLVALAFCVFSAGFLALSRAHRLIGAWHTPLFVITCGFYFVASEGTSSLLWDFAGLRTTPWHIFVPVAVCALVFWWCQRFFLASRAKDLPKAAGSVLIALVLVLAVWVGAEVFL